MKKSLFSQFFILCILVAFVSSFNIYAQDNSTGMIPEKYGDKIHTQYLQGDKVNTQYNFDDFLASLGYAYGAQSGLMHDIFLPSGVVGNMPAWSTGTAYASGMTRDPSLTPNSYWIVDVGDSVWQFDQNTGMVTYWGTFTVPVGANGWAFNPADGMFYLATGTDLWVMPPPPPVPGPMTPTLIGPFNTGGLMIDLCFDNVNIGLCYGYDLGTDAAYTINIFTGNATIIGPLGYNANFGQGMGHDYERGWIYLTAFDYGAFDGQLRVMDPETGQTTVLASFGVNQMDPFSAQTDPMLLLPGPGRAIAPSPFNGYTNVPGVPNVTLTWANPVGTTGNTVYFGTDVNSASIIYSGGAITTLPVTVNYSTTYYWWVDCSGVGNTPGTLWSFTAEPYISPAVPLPVIADFEDGIFPPTSWTQNGVIWGNYQTVSGYGVGDWSAVADFYGVGSGFDDLVTIEYISTGAPNPMLTFDWAYATYPGAVDHLTIYYSTDSGTSWLLLADMYDAAPGDDNLNPFNLSQTGAYFPLNTEWSTRSINLPPNTTHVSFTAVTDYGNLLWLDNIQITSELFVDGFENPPYVYPGMVACQNSAWTTWSGAPCGNEDATISTNYAYSGTQTALIDFVAPRDVDLVYLTGTSPKTSGKWYMNFWLYIPEGGAGYFNTQATFTVDWGMECYFNLAGAGVLDNGATIPFVWQEDTWHQCMVVVDLNTSTAEFWFGQNIMTQLATWDWTRGGTIPNTLDGYDFFGATTLDQMYIDDFRFSDLAPPILQAQDDAGTVSIDIATQVAPGTFAPLATVKNYGTDTNTFDVLMTITPGSYTSTKTVTALAGGAEQQVTFDNFTGTTGAYTVTVTTLLIGDEDPANDSKTQSLYVWDPDGTWSTAANYPQNVYLGSAQGYSNGSVNKLFSIAGITASGLETECYEYDVPTDTWTPIALLPVDRDRHATALVGDFVYQIGGYDIGNTIQSTAYKYDIGSDIWTPIASLPVPIGWNKAVGYGTNYIYHAGGYDGTNVLADVYVYDIGADTWTLTASPMPAERFGGAFSIVGDQLIYVGGAGGGIEDDVFVGTITAPGVIAWITADKPFPGSGKISYGPNNDLTGRMVSSEVFTKGMLTEAGYPPGSMYRFDGAPWGSDAMIVAGGSPSSSWVAANPNPCYIYKPATDEWIAKQNTLAPVTAASSGSVYDGADWKFIMTGGIDEAGVLNDTTQIFTQTLGGTTFALSVSVVDGWNMVSIPGLHPTNQNVTTWWSNLTGSVFKFDNGYVSVTTAATGIGYWLNNSGAETYSYAAINIVTHDPIPVVAGWNMIGGYENTAPVSGLIPSAGTILSVFGYSNGYVTATDLVPGYGYWINVTDAGTITIPDPPLSKGSGEVVEYFKEDWGKIIITDNAGRSYTLYAVNGEVDLNKYELPPMPPVGMFDIRYGSDRIAEDINSSIQSIEMSGIEHPVRVRVENMSITLQDESGNNINAQLNPGEEITINNSSINKLLIISGEIGAPIEYALEQNYPNPFNPSTMIKFSVPEATNVTLTIYNTLGQRVTELVNTKLEAGWYSYQWDARNLATGMYIYELRTDKFVSIKKMMLLK